MFSTTNTDSELYKLNHANGQPFTVSSETANLIQEGIHYSELSGGAFDLTIEPVSALWDFKADKPTVPSSDAIAQAVSHVDYTKVDIQDNTVTLEDPEAGIDLGAIAKGYIADQVKTYLKKQGIKHAIINLGGNVDVIGTKPDGSKYNIGIQKPFDESGEAITSVQLKDQTVVTSGIYERYFKKKRKTISSHPGSTNRISVREQSLQCIDHHRLFYKSRCTQHNLLSTGIRERNGTDPEYGWSGGDIYYG